MAEIFSTSLFNDANLKALYRFENGAITTDSKGSNTLSTSGTVINTASGEFGYGVDFSNANTANWVRIVAGDLGIAGNSDLSMSLWVKLQTQPASNTTKTIIQHASTTTTDRYMRLNYKDNGGTKQLEIDMSGVKTTFNVDLGTTNWHNVIIVRDVTNGHAFLYVDGVAQISNATLGTGAYGAKRFDIGGDEDGTNGAISAFIDDAAIFNRVLTSSEASNIYTGNFSSSISASISPSASLSPSSSSSRSLSPSASVSPSSSVSPSPGIIDLRDRTSNANDIVNHGATDITTSLPNAVLIHAAQVAAASSQYLTIPDANQLSVPTTGKLTLEFWIKFNSLVDTYVFWKGAGGASNYEYSINFSANGIMGANFYSNDGNIRYTKSSAVSQYTTGVWYHCAVTIDDTLTFASTNVNIYIDEVEKTSTHAEDNTHTLGNQNSQVDIGRRTDTNTLFGNYIITDIRIWNTARSTTELTNNKNILLTGSESGLVAYYPFGALSSPSASVSPSPSISPSSSSSSSRSPSSSLSPSISPSASLSPSSSISASISPSSSTSSSISPSSSTSPSLSPSSSISSSLSPSPSLGYSDYSRTARQVLPLDTNDLNTFYTDNEKTLVAKRDGQYVPVDGALAYMIHQFKNFVGGNTSCAIEWEGKSTLAPEDSTVFLQIFNQQSQVWDTKDVESDAEENQNFELEARLEDLTHYKDQDNVIISRVYQLAI